MAYSLSSKIGFKKGMQGSQLSKAKASALAKTSALRWKKGFGKFGGGMEAIKKLLKKKLSMSNKGGAVRGKARASQVKNTRKLTDNLRELKTKTTTKKPMSTNTRKNAAKRNYSERDTEKNMNRRRKAMNKRKAQKASQSHSALIRRRRR